MWRRWRRKGHEEGALRSTLAELEAVVVGEASAVGEGRVVDRLWAQGCPIPAWAWLNALAHRPVREIGDLIGPACDRPDDPWADAVVDIAVELNQITSAVAAQIQAEVFGAAERNGLVEGSSLEGPDQLVRVLRGRLADGRLRSRPGPGGCPDRPRMQEM